MKIIHGYGAISKWHKRRKSEDFLPQLLWWYHAKFVTDEHATIVRFVHAHAMWVKLWYHPNFQLFQSSFEMLSCLMVRNFDTSKVIVHFVHEVHQVFVVTLSTFWNMLCGWNDDTMPTFNLFRVHFEMLSNFRVI